MKDKEKKSDGQITSHKEAKRDYHILETYEAGIVLVGCEVKALRDHQASLAGSFARVENGEVFLYNLYIAPYEMGNRENPETKRVRKLLLKHSEIERLNVKMVEKGLAIIPLRMYFNARGIAKVEIAVARGKTHGDRREDIKKATQKREIDRAIKNRNRR